MTVLTREAVKRRPRAFWERAWQAMCRRSNYQLLFGTRFLSIRVELAGSPGADFKGPLGWNGYVPLQGP